jgi:hypothetical protein
VEPVNKSQGLIGVLGILMLVSAVAQGQEETCQSVEGALNAKVGEIQAMYEGVVSKKQKEIESNAQRLKEDAPETGGAIGKVKIDVKWTDKKVILDLPTTKLTDKKIIVDLPSVTMKDQKWVFDVPVVRMETRKVGQRPETKCEEKRGGAPFYLPGIECVTRWKDLFMDVPVTTMDRREIILGVPEFTMVRQEFVVGVPEFYMNRQEWILRIPEVTVKDIEVEADKYKARADEFGKTSRIEMEGITAKMQAEIEVATLDQTSAYFDCQRQQIVRQRDAALVQLDAAAAALQAGVASASGAGATQTLTDLKVRINELATQRQNIVDNFGKALAELDTTQKSLYKPKGAVASAGEQSSPYSYQFVTLPVVQ